MPARSMKRIIILAALLSLIPMPARVDRFCVGRVSWSKANIETLREADLSAVAQFVNDTRPTTFLTNEIFPNQVVGFAWANVGTDETDLVVALDFAGRGFDRIWIYSHGSGDSLAIQELEGWSSPGGLKTMLQDLNGDGVNELVIPTDIRLGVTWIPVTAAPVWPAVYRPKAGKWVEPVCGLPGVRPEPHSVALSTKYVEASRDFPNYYDTQVLPKLDQTISMLQQKAAQGDENPGALAHFVVVRDKILRVLGRDPTAGLSQAYQWMNSDDPGVLQCAIVTFKDIAGHEQDAKAADAKYNSVLCERHPAMAMCRNAANR